MWTTACDVGKPVDKSHHYLQVQRVRGRIEDEPAAVELREDENFALCTSGKARNVSVIRGLVSQPSGSSSGTSCVPKDASSGHCAWYGQACGR